MIRRHDPSAAGTQMSFKGRMSYGDYLHLEETLKQVSEKCSHGFPTKTCTETRG